MSKTLLCPHSQGRKVVGVLTPCEPPFARVGVLAVVGLIVDRPCPRCGGVGKILQPQDFTTEAKPHV